MSEPFIGQVKANGFQFAPEKWSACEGQSLAISSNQALFSLLGTAYGGDGRTSFALPDLRGTAPMSFGNHPGSRFDYNVGQRAGSETHTMTTQELAQHTHLASNDLTLEPDISVKATTENGDAATPSTGAYLATALPPGGGPDKPEKIYNSSVSAPDVTLASLTNSSGSVTGSVDVGVNGKSQAFNIIQSSLTVSYAIALLGLFPSRS